MFVSILANRCINFFDHKISEFQNGFRPKRGTIGAMFVLRRSAEMRWAAGSHTYFCFIDLQKAFDSVNREFLWKVLSNVGFPDEFVDLLAKLHDGTARRFRYDGFVTAPFAINSGVRRGCVIAPILCNIFIDFCYQACRTTRSCLKHQDQIQMWFGLA